MARKIIAFLGITARATRYRFADEVEYEGEVFPQALMRYWDEHRGGFDQALFLLTDDARRKTWPVLAQSQDPRLVPIAIAEGRTEQEMWSWLEALLPHIEPGDSLIFDITHGLRSAPFLIFLFTAYLQQVRNARIEAVLYGAYELARGGPTPVIDLSRFVRLLDWLTATAMFQATGDARHLAQVMRAIGEQRRLGYLKNAAQDLERLSLALMLTRPLEVMEQADRWARTMERLHRDAPPALRPLDELVAQLREDYAARALRDPEAHPREALQRQYDLIRWYLDNNQILQAATLAVEWIISLVAWLYEDKLILRREDREEWARAIHAVNRWKRGEMDQADLGEKALRITQRADLVEALTDVWDPLTQVRNDLNHAGMRKHPRKAHKLVQAMQKLREPLARLQAFLQSPSDPSPEAGASP